MCLSTKGNQITGALPQHDVDLAIAIVRSSSVWIRDDPHSLIQTLDDLSIAIAIAVTIGEVHVVLWKSTCGWLLGRWGLVTWGPSPLFGAPVICYFIRVNPIHN